MRMVDLEALRRKLRAYLRLAVGGEEVLVADLKRRGLMTAPLALRHGPPPRVSVAKLSELMAELDSDRSER